MDIAVNDIIQIKPTHIWAKVLAVVVEIKPFGVLASVQLPEEKITYIRLNWEDFEKVGKIKFK